MYPLKVGIGILALLEIPAKSDNKVLFVPVKSFLDWKLMELSVPFSRR